MLCDYGCGKEAKYTLKNGKQCCSSAAAGCPIQKEKNSLGLKKAYAENRKGYTYNPKSAWSKGKRFILNEEIFIENGRHATEFLKARISKDNLKDYRCDRCGIDEWNGETIVLDLDHINGTSNDNRLENLRYLCPNCHSQTETYKGRNKNTGTKKVTDQEMYEAYQSEGNIRRALIKVGLSPKGGNYDRLKKLIKKSTG